MLFCSAIRRSINEVIKLKKDVILSFKLYLTTQMEVYQVNFNHR